MPPLPLSPPIYGDGNPVHKWEGGGVPYNSHIA